jgi:isopentenyl-diphosphate Delta-isomerase
MTTSISIPLVNKNDEIIGHGEKLEVHVKGLLHRAFSILIFNKNKEMLVHQRAFTKYHSGGLWTNACCGHPNEGEEIEMAIHRRLLEEMGFDCDLTYAFTLRYRANLDKGLVENEIDHVYVGHYDGHFEVNPDEVANYKWVGVSALQKEIDSNPDNFTVWFKEILKDQAFSTKVISV